VLPEDIEFWLLSLPETDRLKVFQALSEYLSMNELKTVMSELGNGKDLLSIHRQLGLIGKYYVDLLRIRQIKGF
jgi:hypothetical protein